MSAPLPSIRVRRSFRDIEADHYKAVKNGDKGPTELDTLIDAWTGIQTKDPTDLNSFFMVGGYHGEPFRGAGWANSEWWGGYCYHGQILFPSWHRAYLMRLEDALRSIPGCENVALPFWDECDDQSVASGVPETFGQPKFTKSNGQVVDPNPLFSYKFNGSVYDNVTGLKKDGNYSKLRGYKTVRYPLSGLVGTEEDRQATKAHNNEHKDPVENFSRLNKNVKNWLVNPHIVNDKGKKIPAGVKADYAACLEIPYYTVFSNTTSAAAYTQEFFDASEAGGGPGAGTATLKAVPLEQPHNSIHLAVGGFESPTPDGGDFDAITGANGDMGENDTAAFDPIFYFHHCYIDRMFWLWQKKWGQTTKLILEDRFYKYPGTNTVDSQGPVPGMAANTWLTLDTPLDPFTKIVQDGKIVAVSTFGLGEAITSKDVADIEGVLGYTYGPGSFDGAIAPPVAVPGTEKSVVPAAPMATPRPKKAVPTLRVPPINRGAIAGSFVVSTWAKEADGKEKLVDVNAVLSRRRTQGCANCQNHLAVKSFVPLGGLDKPHEAEFRVKVHTRADPTGEKLGGKVG